MIYDIVFDWLRGEYGSELERRYGGDSYYFVVGADSCSGDIVRVSCFGGRGCVIVDDMVMVCFDIMSPSFFDDLKCTIDGICGDTRECA